MECCHTGKHGEKGCCKDLEKQGIKMEDNPNEIKKGKSKGIWFIFVGIIVVFAIIILFSRSSGASSYENVDAAAQIDIYKSITCGCCDVYSKYVDGKTEPRVNSFNVQNPEEISTRYGIPKEMESCHTMIIGNYFVEGHVPLEAVEKLLKEQPDIKGIAMPGMPMGSPGMTGQKSGDFIIYAVANDGTYSEFMRI